MKCAGCKGQQGRTDGKCGELKKLSSPWGGSFYLAPADGCHLAMRTVARSSEFSEDGNPDFFKMGNLLFLKHCVGQTKHVCGLSSVCGLPFSDLWFIVLTEHDISVPICNLKACYFQTQFISVLYLPPSLLYYLYTRLTPPQDYALFWWHSLHLFQFYFFSVNYYSA